MHDWFFRHGGRKRLIDWLGVDSWIDSTLAETWEREGPLERHLQLLCALPPDAAGSASSTKAVSEALTLGAGGFVVLYVLAIPALTEFDENRSTPASTRQVPRPQRRRDRPARHPAQRCRAAGGDPRSSHQGHARHRGPPLLRALRRRHHRHGPRAVRECARQRGGAGRLDHHPAARQELVPVLRALARSASSRRRSSPSCWSRASPSARSSSSISTAPIWAAAPSASRRPRSSTSASRCARSRWPRPRCWRACSRRPRALRRTSTCRPPARAPNEVLNNLVEAGYMSAGQVHAARLNPAKIVETSADPQPRLVPRLGLRGGPAHRRRPQSIRAHRPHHRRSWPAAGGAGGARQHPAPVRQRGRDAAASYTGAMVSMEPDGAVRAMVGGLDYEDNQFNRAPTPIASPAPPSSSTSTPRPSRTATIRARSCATTAAPAGTGRPRTTTAAAARADR